MLLSAEQLSGITQGLAGRSGVEDGNRRAPRGQIKAVVSVVPVVAGSRTTAVLAVARDLSSRGINILFAKGMRRGAEFVAQLPRADGGTLSLLCTVVHSREVRSGLFAIGAEFTCQIDGNGENRGNTDAEAERIRGAMLGRP